MEKVEIRFYNKCSKEYISTIVGPDDDLCIYSKVISDHFYLLCESDNCIVNIVLTDNLFTAISYFVCLVKYGVDVDTFYKGPYHYGYSNLANVIVLAKILNFDEKVLMNKLLFPSDFEFHNDEHSDWFYARLLYMCKVIGFNKLACYLNYFVGLPWCFALVDTKIINVQTFCVNVIWFRSLKRARQVTLHRYCDKCLHVEKTLLWGFPFQSYEYKRSIRNPGLYYDITYRQSGSKSETNELYS